MPWNGRFLCGKGRGGGGGERLANLVEEVVAFVGGVGIGGAAKR